MTNTKRSTIASIKQQRTVGQEALTISARRIAHPFPLAFAGKANVCGVVNDEHFTGFLSPAKCRCPVGRKNSVSPKGVAVNEAIKRFQLWVRTHCARKSHARIFFD